ncbi:MAG: Crp/Fnr family transcriptional regulator [Myxococcaceae bacterium]|nr:Crp/Fnr family transcriptional regulator [Myxococcaceae bacterium]
MAARSRSPAATPDVWEMLTHAPLFSRLGPQVLRTIAASSRVRSLGPGEPLWREGEPATALGLVLAGRLKLCRSRDKREVMLDIALPGEVLGEIAFTLGSAYSSDAVSLRMARVLLVPVALIDSALEKDARATRALALELAQQVLRLSRAVEDRAATSVEARVAGALVRLAERAGEEFDGGVLIPLKLRRSDLAALAATTLESTSRKIAEWHRQGWVTPQPAGYLIRNLPALRQLQSGDPLMGVKERPRRRS